MNRVIRRTATLLGFLMIASASHAIGISGTVFAFNAAPVWPCDIDVIDRATGLQVLGIADSTLPNGNYNLVLANGRYDLLFRPKVGNHIFKANVPDQRVSNNTLTVHMTLPLGKYVKGRVVGTDNLPVANVNIKFATAAGATPANLQDSATNPDGTFNALVEPGFWNIEVIPANLTHKVPVMVTRSSNQFGPYQFPEKAIPLFTTNLLNGKNIPLYGDGLNVRDWLYVLDNCRAVDLVLRQGTLGEIYNIGAHNEITNVDLVGRLLKLTGRDASAIDKVADRLGHDRRYSITTDKIHALGWKPQRELDEALDETVGWYRDNRSWWEPLKARAAF